MRLMGAALLSLAGLLVGLMAAGALRRDVRCRRELVRLLEAMAYELERFRTPLPELFQSLSYQTEGAALALCERLLEALPSLGEVRFQALWESSLASLPSREREILRPLGSVMGRYGTEQILPALENSRREMERAGAEAQSRWETSGRVYIGLCTAGGLMLAVMLL